MKIITTIVRNNFHDLLNYLSKTNIYDLEFISV